jgi:hypothetical protein
MLEERSRVEREHVLQLRAQAQETRAAELAAAKAEAEAQRARAEAESARHASEVAALRTQPVAAAKARVTNEADELLLTLELDFPGTDERGPLLTEARMVRGQQLPLALTGREGQQVRVLSTVVWMGQSLPLEPVTVAFVPGGVLELTLDVDTALGRHRLRGSWRK